MSTPPPVEVQGVDGVYGYPVDPLNNFDLDGRMGDGKEGAWRQFVKSQIFRQRKILGPLVMRNGRPAIHWRTPRSPQPNRIEYDRRNGWHYNKAEEPGSHYPVRRGFSDFFSDMRGLTRTGVFAAMGLYYAGAASQSNCGTRTIRSHGRQFQMSTCYSWM